MFSALLALGLVSLTVSWAHRDGGEMVRLVTWAQHVVTFRGDAASYVAAVPPIFKLHLLLGMTIFPSSRSRDWFTSGAASARSRTWHAHTRSCGAAVEFVLTQGGKQQ